MKLHTNLPSSGVTAALRTAQAKGLITRDVAFAVFTPERSLTHPHGYEIQLGTYDKHSLPAGYKDRRGRTRHTRNFKNTGTSGADSIWAATWHEWGWLIAEIFAADPSARWGANPARSRRPWGYFSPEDFHVKTGGQFRPAVTWQQPALMYVSGGSLVIPVT